MARTFNASAVAHALEVDQKWLDNLLTHNDIAGIDKGRQGIARQLPYDAIATIFIAKQLMANIGASATAALGVAKALAQKGEVEIASGLRLEIDLTTTNERLSQRIFDAVQAAPPKTRGRPRRRHFSEGRDPNSEPDRATNT